MSVSFRSYLEALRSHGELLEISRATDLRDVAALVPQSEQAILFKNVRGYAIPVVSGLLQSRNRLALAMEVPYGKIADKLRGAIDRPIEPTKTKTAPVDEVVLSGDDVNLYQLPVPLFSLMDGGPMITGAVVIAEDPEYGMNAGIYRLMLKERNVTGIDIVTPNNLRRFAERALRNKEALPISINIGAHPYELIASTFKAALGINELTMSGGLRQEGLALAEGKTIPTPHIADAEIVLEGEILPEGWIHPEGPFCEFNRLMGGAHLNPRVRIKAILHRKDPIYYALHMPWENIWMSAPIYEAAAWRVLREAGVQTTAIHLTPGGCCHWHLIAAIKKQPGDGKNAIMALLSIADIKHVVVTDDDIDIFDPVDLEWAIATRVQADRDVLIVPNARSKPLDPSLPPTSGIPTTAKMGIDATIPENVPRNRYNRIVYLHQKTAKLENLLGDAAGEQSKAEQADGGDEERVAEKIAAALGGAHLFYAELLELFPQEEYRTLTEAMALLQQQGRIHQDQDGKYMTSAAKT